MKEIPARDKILAERKERLRAAGIEAAILERDDKIAIRYRDVDRSRDPIRAWANKVSRWLCSGEINGERRRARPLLAWLGLLLMAVSFVWLQLTAVPRSARVETSEPSPPSAVRARRYRSRPRRPGFRDDEDRHGGKGADARCRPARWNGSCNSAVWGLCSRALDDSYVSLQDRAAIANEQPECVFVSIHFDEAGAARGDRNRDLLRGASDFVSGARGFVVAVSAADFVGAAERREPEPGCLHPGIARGARPRRSIAARARNNFSSSPMCVTPRSWWKAVF